LGLKKALGWSVELVKCPRKLAPKEVLRLWASEWAKEGEGRLGETVASARLPGVAEVVGSGAAIFLDRAEPQDEPRDYKRLPETSEAFVYDVAMSRLMARRLARS